MGGLQFVGSGIRGGGGGGAELNLAAGAALPSIVVDGQIFVVTSDPVNDWYVSTNRPDVPVAGDLWVRVAEGENILTLSDEPPYFRIGLLDVSRFNGAEWIIMDAYLGLEGAWVQLSMYIPPIGTPLESFTWVQIDRISGDGNASTYFSVGDTKNISIGEEVYAVEIIGFGHDDLADGSGKAGVTFCLKNCLSRRYSINATLTNVGGWGACTLRDTLQSTIKDQIESTLTDVIKPVLKKSSTGNGNSTINTSVDDLFLLAEIEVYGSTPYSRSGEGAQYSRFSTASSRIKTVSGTAAQWWERSPYYGNANYFCTITATGAANAGDFATNANGVAFGFCV